MVVVHVVVQVFKKALRAQLGTPMKFSETPCEIRGSPPSFGEHTEEILKWLGYAEAEILGMRQEGVI